VEKKKKKKRVHYYLYSPGSTLSTGGSRDLPKSAFSVHFHAHTIYVHSFVEKVYDYDTFTCLHSSIEALFCLVISTRGLVISTTFVVSKFMSLLIKLLWGRNYAKSLLIKVAQHGS